MKLFVGLGNPGSKYAGNRHNIGFAAVDRLQETSRFHFSPWKAGFQGQVSTGRIGKENVLLLKPETFMNKSGQSVGEAARYYKIEPKDIYVFHDELDLKPGQIRVKRGGGNGGHNGLRSVDAHIGKEYWRIRLGIGHPGHKDLVVDHVLSDFTKADETWRTALIDALARMVDDLVVGDIPEFCNQITQAVRAALGSQEPLQSAAVAAKNNPNALTAPKMQIQTQIPSDNNEGPMARALKALLPSKKKDTE